MNSQQPVHSLVEFELPIEEFEDRTINSVNSSNDLQTYSTENRSGLRRRTKILGRGSYGHVWLQEHDVDRAVKEVALSQLSKDGIDHLNEISTMARFSKLKHDNCAIFPEFYGYAMNSSTLFLAMEYFPHRDLKRHIEASTMNEQEAKEIVYDILLGLKVMHAEGIVHRDLKLENIFVVSKRPESRWSVKIGDFGISKRIPPGQEWVFSRRGTRHYIAPEVEGLIDVCQKSPGAIDMWSLGIIVYSLATNQFPFAPPELTLFCCNDGKFPFPGRPMLEHWSKEGLAFAEALLKPSPQDRLSAEDALQHSWIASMNEEPVGPSNFPTPSKPGLSVHPLDEVDRCLVINNQDTASKNTASPSLMTPIHTYLQPSVTSMPSWLGPTHATPYASRTMPYWPTTPLGLLSDDCPRVAFIANLDERTVSSTEPPRSAASPRPLSPIKTITGPVSGGDEIPSASFDDIPPTSSTSEKSRPGRSRGRLDRRATAPTPLWPVVDAIDLISPRTTPTQADGPVRIGWSDEREGSDLNWSTRAMSLTEPLDPPPSPRSQTSSLMWRDTRLKHLSRSNSDSLVRPSYGSYRSSQAWKRASALEFVTNPKFYSSVNALYHAIQVGRDDVVDLLLDRGVDIETVFRDPPHLQYGTALHLAVSCGQADVVNLLLRRGASATAKAKAELSNFKMRWLEPLHLAAYHGLEEIGRRLLDHGARIEANAIGNYTNRAKRTPLHLAVLGDESDEIARMVHLLLEYGADPNVKDDMGMRPGDYAVMLGKKDLRADLPISSSSKLKARVVQMRIKFGPFALAGPLILGAVGVAML